jgi:pimeloyl-ACP methyl ester carboxylesterase
VYLSHWDTFFCHLLRLRCAICYQQRMNKNSVSRLLALVLFVGISFVWLGSEAGTSSNPNTTAACQKFLSGFDKDALAERGTLEVPLNKSSKMSVFYWVKRGTDRTKVPILLIHGGPGGNSWRYYSSFKASSYAGDIVAIDNRNEGCSHVMSYDREPEDFQVFRSRRIVEDLEALRVKLYGSGTKWRIFGQSRGATIAHHYLEMFPDSLESIQTHGFAALTGRAAGEYTYLRSHFNARASDRFAAQYPDAAKVIVEAKRIFGTEKICLPMNFLQLDLPEALQPQVCGGVITDSISYKLSAYGKWSVIASDLLTLRNPDGSLDRAKLLAMFRKEINGNIYVGFLNYIMGTNGLDVGSPSPQAFGRIAADSKLQNALISEGRFVAEAVYPAYLASGYGAFVSGGDGIDFSKVKKWLEKFEFKNGRKFEITLFSSHFDTIAGPELYDDEKTLLGDFVTVFPLMNSGHDGWSTEPAVAKTLFR